MYKKILLALAFGLSLSLVSFSYAADAVMCTMEAKMCPDGITYVGRTGPNCEFEACPATTPPGVCSKEYMPVCAQPPMPVCPVGMGCIQMMPQPKTYGNSCMMKADNATLINQGECELANPYPSIPLSSQKSWTAKIQALIAKLEAKISGNSDRVWMVNRMLDILDTKMETYKNPEVVQFVIDALTDYKISSLGAQ